MDQWISCEAMLADEEVEACLMVIVVVSLEALSSVSLTAACFSWNTSFIEASVELTLIMAQLL